MFNFNVKGKLGAILPSEWQDQHTPIGKATQTYLRALQANGITDVIVTLDNAGKSVTIPVPDLVGAN